MEGPVHLDQPTREVFGNIAPWMQNAFYGLMAVTCAILVFRVWRRVALWRQGVPGGFEMDWRLWSRRILTFAVAQKRVHKKSLGAVLHLLLFSGFVVLTIGTTLLMIAHAGPVYFHVGWYYLFYELTMDVFGVAFCAGCGLALYRRALKRPKSLGHRGSDWYLLGLLLAIGLTGFVLEALRLHYTQVPQEVARWSTAAWMLERSALQPLAVETTRAMHLGAWWLHAILIGLFFATLPVTRFLHVITAPMNIATRTERAMGALAPLSIEKVEETGRVGVASIQDFSRQQLLSLDSCMECGRCEDACPAWASGKPLSPKAVVVDLRAAMETRPESGRPLMGLTISEETLWACTMCQACVQECPTLIGHVDLISDMRRSVVGEGRFSGPPSVAMRNLGSRFNPYGQANTDRFAWSDGMEVPTVESNPSFDYLFWVGCAGSFDPRAQKVTRATVKLFKEAGVNFAVLGAKEKCTGDPARRIGDEFLFQELAQSNIETLDRHKAKRIVTSCPHCFNTLGNEYAPFGGSYEVKHHSQLLEELLREGRLQSTPESETPVTLHDPCYLARANGEVQAQRSVLNAASSELREMPRHGKKTFCCGAGGGRMWFDEDPSQRVSALRATEATCTGAKRMATACPFCLNMMTDAATSGAEEMQLEVLDIAELLLERQSASLSDAQAQGKRSES